MLSTRSKALALSFFTVAYNPAEGCIAIWCAAISRSSALAGLGLDNFVELLAGMVMSWRLQKLDLATDDEQFEKIERKAARLVEYSFFALGGYVIFDASYALLRRESPETSFIGTGLGIASLVIMPILFTLKYRLGKSIGSRSLVADSKDTLACMMLSVTLLVGLIAFYFWRLRRIDAAAALVIAVLIIREGFETREDVGSECTANDD